MARNFKFYCNRRNFLKTNSTLYIDSAIMYANERSQGAFDGKKSGPLLLAINALKYISRLEEGQDYGEVEISGLIDFRDIVVIDNKEKFWKFISMLNLKKPDKYLFWLMNSGFLLNDSAVLHPDCIGGEKH